MNSPLSKNTEIEERTRNSLFLGRQPILNREQVLVGYEFLFRPTAADQVQVTNPAAATADVVCKAFGELGLSTALGKQRAFIKVDEAFICNDLVLLLPVETVVIELDLATVEPSPTLLTRCQELNEAGYLLAVSGIVAMSDAFRALLGMVTYAKIDIRQEQTSLASLVAQLRVSQIEIIATRVETSEAFAIARALGCDAFQGYYFARPVLVSGRKLGAATQSLIRLINLLNEDADTSQIESVMKGEPGLVMNMLRLTNSVAMGLPVKVTSVRQAITVLGRKQLQRWLQLLLFNRPNGPSGLRANPLMQLAALRACFLELLVQRCYPARREWRDPAFIIGLMSVIPAALEMPMEEILAEVAVASEVRDALLNHGGPIGQLLNLVERYDENDVESASNMLAQMGGRVGQQTLNLCLTESIAWVLSLSMEMQD